MLQAYVDHVAERAALGIPPLPLSAKQTSEAIELLKSANAKDGAFLLDLLTHRVPAGVDDAAKVKASYLAAVAHGTEKSEFISRARATELLGTMLGGYNISPMIDLLDDAEVGAVAAEGLKKTLLMFDQFHDVKEKADKGNANAKGVLQSWADAEWFTSRPEVPQSITVSIFKVAGEINTDDLSPAPDATTRPDIPMHALAMHKNARPGIVPEEDGKRGPVKFIEDLRAKRPPRGLRGRRGRHRFVAQVGHQLGAVVHRRRHSLRAQQAFRRRLPRRQDRSRSSTTRWKTRARCRSSSTSRRWKWATWSSCVPTKARR
jgi:aconitate hydratase 2/2-methylisocitrate dehydratase